MSHLFKKIFTNFYISCLSFGAPNCFFRRLHGFKKVFLHPDRRIFLPKNGKSSTKTPHIDKNPFISYNECAKSVCRRSRGDCGVRFFTEFIQPPFNRFYGVDFLWRIK